MRPLRKPAEKESSIQDRLRDALVIRDWYVLKTHGNAYQAGFPDLYLAHKRFGTRWVEVKKPTGSRFTQSQIDVFTKFSSRNVGVWVLTSETEIDKLFGPSNWHTFLRGGIDLNHEVPRIPKRGPEAVIQDAVIARLTSECSCRSKMCREHPLQNWFCVETYGSTYQSGFPDTYCCHAVFGTRWIEFKNPKSYKFTPAQVDVFPRLAAEGVGIHIITDVTDWELRKIHGPANWHVYLWPAR